MNVDGSSVATPRPSASAEDAMEVDASQTASAPDDRGTEEISDDEIETIQ